jgi:hypothetical protein
MKYQSTSAIFICILAVAFQFKGMSQSCYVQKTDASDIDVSHNQTQLEGSACELKNAIPTTYSLNFKVFSYGFYMLNPSMVNGVEQMRLRAKTQSEAESQYFLLIMKQSSSEGLYTKFFVEIKLPTVGVFACFQGVHKFV